MRRPWLQLATMDPYNVDAETVDDELDVLGYLAAWEQAPHRWDSVFLILQRMAAALAVRDGVELRDAIADLQLSGPVRIQRIGSANTTGIPEPVLDPRNTLVTSSPRNAPPDPRRRVTVVDRKLTEQEFVAHLFAPLDGPDAGPRKPR